MIELLSLPRRPSQRITLPSIKFETGLPINSLPGWEGIPLNLKLPMLKCPGNQVIFSKNKIGQSLRHLKYAFDPSGHEIIPEYNPLHDSNLKTFYANEANLKRLRENGEITLDNDVICNLKDFNEYRQQLHKSQLHYMLQEMCRQETDQRDRVLVSHAEQICSRHRQSPSPRDHSHSVVVNRKFCLDRQRQERYRKLHQKTLQKIADIRVTRANNQTAMQHEKDLRKLDGPKHLNLRNDLQRQRLISLKKLVQFKKERLHKNLRKMRETRLQNERERQMRSWNERLAERIAKQEKVSRLLERANTQKRLFMEDHKRRYQGMWSKIQQDIKQRSLQNRTQRNLSAKNNNVPKNLISEGSLIAEFKGRFEKLLDSEVCAALNAALDLEKQAKVPFEPSDPIYRAAHYIMEVILGKFNKDLSNDETTFKNLYDRIDRFFDEAKSFVVFRSTQIIASFQDLSNVMRNERAKRTSVSFEKLASTIGMSSYQIHPLIEVKEVSNRKPTPAGSLASLIANSSTSLVEKNHCSHLPRNDLIFIEHYLVKFKRELIVGIGRKVFAAIQCHFEKRVMGVRQELLDIDRKFLLNQATKAILSYAMNPLNFESALKLCTSALASDIIWSLQKQLLKPSPDRRRTTKPSIQCCCKENSMQLCLFCNERK